MIPDSVIVALQKEMQTAGYISREAVQRIADEFHLSPTQVYSVASFYQQFTFVPQGKNVIAVCTGTACFIAGAEKILAVLREELGIGEGEVTPDGKFSIQKNTRCLGKCASAPIVTINDRVYEKATPAQIREAIRELR
ncbi:MAG: NAD(P)H-dependent oxidoreductase subunit E [Eubacteriales bacterium]|nr:NAD(P)H-dependent oxidoreductase subunit E [Eubacteriales bacterium]